MNRTGDVSSEDQLLVLVKMGSRVLATRLREAQVAATEAQVAATEAPLHFAPITRHRLIA